MLLLAVSLAGTGPLGTEDSTEDDGGWMSTVPSAVQAGVVLLIGVAIVASNVIVVATLLTSPDHRDAMGFYLLSLAIADLLCGVFIVPLSVHAAIAQRWVYGDVICRLEGYLEAALWTVTVYTFMWIGVDRYLAVRKPLRYDTIQTRTRCQCWMVFTWVTAALLCCPPLLGYSKANFYRDEAICVLDWGNMLAYSLTLAALVLGPSLATLCYTYAYIFSAMRRLRKCIYPPDKEYASALCVTLSSPYHILSFGLVLAFWLSWLPWIVLHVYEYLVAVVESPALHFCATWLGMLNSFWKTLIYIGVSPEFRTALRALWRTMFCRHALPAPLPLPLTRHDRTAHR